MVQWTGDLQSCNSSGVCSDHGDKGDTISSMAVFSPASLGNALYTVQGKVGIGTTAPKYLLQVHEDSSTYAYLSFTNGTTEAGSTDGVLVGLDPAEDFKIHSYESNSIKFYIDNAEKLRINSSGNVGIGTDSPAGKLDVNGSIYQRGISLHADYVFEPGYELESIREHAE